MKYDKNTLNENLYNLISALILNGLFSLKANKTKTCIDKCYLKLFS